MIPGTTSPPPVHGGLDTPGYAARHTATVINTNLSENKVRTLRNFRTKTSSQFRNLSIIKIRKNTFCGSRCTDCAPGLPIPSWEALGAAAEILGD